MKFFYAFAFTTILFITPPLKAAEPVVSMSESKGIYEIKGEFSVNAPIATTWNVLADYSHISEFVSSIERSKITGLTEKGVLVEQTASASFFLFHKAATVQLEIIEDALNSILFTDISHIDFEDYEGSWKLEQKNDGVNVYYYLRMKSRFMVPGFIKRHVMRKSVAELLEQVKKEIKRRAEQK